MDLHPQCPRRYRTGRRTLTHVILAYLAVQFRSRLPRSLSCASAVECSRVCSAVSAAALSRNITHSASSRQYKRPYSGSFRMLTSYRSEGTHAKYHYMICGVQGDFTRSLVNDPPKTLWTRELKVRIPIQSACELRIHTPLAVRWCLEYLYIVQAWHPYLHWYRYWCGLVDVYPVPLLVSTSSAESPSVIADGRSLQVSHLDW